MCYSTRLRYNTYIIKRGKFTIKEKYKQQLHLRENIQQDEWSLL